MPLVGILGDIERKIEVTDGCWEWKGSFTREGYPEVHTHQGPGGHVRVHRAVYESYVRPLRPDEVIDHLCSNRWCVNPEHMEAVSSEVNAARGMELRGWRGKIQRFFETGRYESYSAFYKKERG